jgi:hypothetical protein
LSYGSPLRRDESAEDLIEITQHVRELLSCAFSNRRCIQSTPRSLAPQSCQSADPPALSLMRCPRIVKAGRGGTIANDGMFTSPRTLETWVLYSASMFLVALIAGLHYFVLGVFSATWNADRLPTATRDLTEVKERVDGQFAQFHLDMCVGYWAYFFTIYFLLRGFAPGPLS